MVKQSATWAGLADANTFAVKGLWTLALLDLRTDRLLSVYEPSAARTNATIARWQKRESIYSSQFKVSNGPFFIRDGWFYSARPFERMALADGSREEFPPPRTNYQFAPTESLQLLNDGKHVLAADQISLWLLELKPEPVDNGDLDPVLSEP